MRERKYIKFRVDMYDGTKFKIIDMKPERDLIHYVWTRLVTLAGKVNLEDNLYMSKNIPYTIETLAIEFNRGADQVKLALEVLIELEMIEVSEHNIYSVKNFAKHQNIKVKEKITTKHKEEDISNDESLVKENLENELYDNKNKGSQNEISQNKVEKIENVRIKDKGDLEITHKDINKIDNNMINENTNNNSQENIPMILKMERNKNVSKKAQSANKINCLDFAEETEDDLMGWFSDGNEKRSLRKGEFVVGEWSF